MSEDKGTYIIQTKGEEGPEFRVAQVCAVDNLFEEYKDGTSTWTPNVKCVVESFNSSKVYPDLETAWDVASSIDNENPTEFGANLITDFHAYDFNDLKKEYVNVG